MKAVISKSDLVSLVNKAQNIVPVKPAIPVLGSVLIEVVDGQFILSATDLITSIRCTAEASVVEEGSIALPARKFFQLARELPSSQIKISVQNNIIEILSGTSVFNIYGMSKSQYPTFPTLTGISQFPICSATLKEMLVRSSFSSAREDLHAELNGVLLQVSNKIANFIATDGRRLSKVFTPIDLDASFQGSYIIPIKAVEEMILLLDETQTEKVYLSLLHDKVILENPHVTLITKLIAGQYPDYEKFLPPLVDEPISIHREELLLLLRQISVLSTEMTGSVRFIFEEGMISLKANRNTLGEGVVNMPANYRGEKLEVAFNPFLFQDALKHSKDETVRFFIKNPYDPGIIADSTGALFVIMPMRLNKPADTNAPENAATT